jgi:hypothetical protein
VKTDCQEFTKFWQILLRTDTRLVFCNRKLTRTDIFSTRTIKHMEFRKPFTVQSEIYSMINNCDRLVTHLGDMDISFVLFNISSKFLLYVECYLLSPKNVQGSTHQMIINIMKSNMSISDSLCYVSDSTIRVVPFKLTS